MMGVFDVLLLVVLIAVAVGALHGRRLFSSVVLFIVFGLLMALVWLRLHAPDVALAEAVVGAGISGVLLLDALGRLGKGEDEGGDERAD